MEQITDAVLAILRRGRMEEDKYHLPQEQLERKLYVKVNEVLEALGGKWNKKAKCHIFDDTTKLREAMCDGIYLDAKREYQFWGTPEALAKQLVEMAELKDTDYIMEPSAGKGAIAKHIHTGKLWLNEINEEMYKGLIKEFGRRFIHVEVSNRDFLSCLGCVLMDKIIMNPPFAKNQDIAHILHAFTCLLPGGILVSLCSEHPFFAGDKQSQIFREFLSNHNAEIIKLKPGAFKESGTMVNARIIKITKEA